MIGSAKIINYLSYKRRLQHSAYDIVVVDVFKTNVNRTVDAEIIIAMLVRYCKCVKVTFDLDDCDKVLRIEHSHDLTCEIIALVNQLGFACEQLMD